MTQAQITERQQYWRDHVLAAAAYDGSIVEYAAANNLKTKVTAQMLRKERYVITTTPARSEAIRQRLPDHLDYQIELERSGIMFGAGPIFEENESVPCGGQIIVRASDFTEARKIADQDPLHKLGLRKYTLRKWIMNEGSMTFTVRYSDQTVLVDPR